MISARSRSRSNAPVLYEAPLASAVILGAGNTSGAGKVGRPGTVIGAATFPHPTFPDFEPSPKAPTAAGTTAGVGTFLRPTPPRSPRGASNVPLGFRHRRRHSFSALNDLPGFGDDAQQSRPWGRLILDAANNGDIRGHGGGGGGAGGGTRSTGASFWDLPETTASSSAEAAIHSAEAANNSAEAAINSAGTASGTFPIKGGTAVVAPCSPRSTQRMGECPPCSTPRMGECSPSTTPRERECSPSTTPRMGECSPSTTPRMGECSPCTTPRARSALRREPHATAAVSPVAAGGPVPRAAAATKRVAGPQQTPQKLSQYRHQVSLDSTQKSSPRHRRSRSVETLLLPVSPVSPVLETPHKSPCAAAVAAGGSAPRKELGHVHQRSRSDETLLVGGEPMCEVPQNLPCAAAVAAGGSPLQKELGNNVHQRSRSDETLLEGGAALHEAPPKLPRVAGTSSDRIEPLRQHRQRRRSLDEQLVRGMAPERSLSVRSGDAGAAAAAAKGQSGKRALLRKPAPITVPAPPPRRVLSAARSPHPTKFPVGASHSNTFAVSPQPPPLRSQSPCSPQHVLSDLSPSSTLSPVLLSSPAISVAAPAARMSRRVSSNSTENLQSSSSGRRGTELPCHSPSSTLSPVPLSSPVTQGAAPTVCISQRASSSSSSSSSNENFSSRSKNSQSSGSGGRGADLSCHSPSSTFSPVPLASPVALYATPAVVCASGSARSSDGGLKSVTRSATTNATPAAVCASGSARSSGESMKSASRNGNGKGVWGSVKSMTANAKSLLPGSSRKRVSFSLSSSSSSSSSSSRTSSTSNRSKSLSSPQSPPEPSVLEKLSLSPQLDSATASHEPSVKYNCLQEPKPGSELIQMRTTKPAQFSLPADWLQPPSSGLEGTEAADNSRGTIPEAAVPGLEKMGSEGHESGSLCAAYVKLGEVQRDGTRALKMCGEQALGLPKRASRRVSFSKLVEVRTFFV